MLTYLSGVQDVNIAVRPRFLHTFYNRPYLSLLLKRSRSRMLPCLYSELILILIASTLRHPKYHGPDRIVSSVSLALRFWGYTGRIPPPKPADSLIDPTTTLTTTSNPPGSYTASIESDSRYHNASIHPYIRASVV
jgi:hypothetical protein